MLVITPKELKDAVARVKSATDAKSVCRSFGAVRFYVAGDASESYIEASTYDNACRRHVTNLAMNMGALDTLVHVTFVDKVLKVFAKADEITVRTGFEGATVFTSGTRKVTAPAESREDWLGADFHGGPRILAGQAKPMAERLAKALTFASKDETRPHLAAVALDLHPSDWPTWVATDSYRLGLFPTNEEDESLVPDEPETHAIDVFGLTKVVKGMKTAETVELYMPPTNDDRWYVVVLDEGRELWQVRKIDGRYPNWRQLIPDNYELEMTLPRTELVSAVEAARVIAERNAPMRLVVNGNVKATVVQPDAPQFEETIDGASVVYLTDAARDLHAGDGVEYGYNPDFLADCAKTIGTGGEIRVRMITPLRPVLMDADGDRALLMPIRINV